MMLAAQPRLRGDTAATIQQRWHMLQLACANESCLTPDDSELQMSGETRTIDTVEHLGGTKSQPVIWILGDDAAAKLHHWVRYDDLREKTSMFVFNREGTDLTEVRNDFILVKDPLTLGNTAGQMHVSDHKVLDISASMIRQHFREERDVARWLHTDVLAYIIERNLYTR